MQEPEATDTDVCEQLPVQLTWPQLIVWILRRDVAIVQQLAGAGDDPQAEYASFKRLRGALARQGTEKLAHHVVGAEIKCAEKVAITALMEGTIRGSVLREDDLLFEPVRVKLSRLEWANDHMVEPNEGCGSIVENEQQYELGRAPRFDRDNVLDFWPATEPPLESDGTGVALPAATRRSARRPTYSFIEADRPLVEKGLDLVRNGKHSANRAAQIVVGDGTNVPGGGNVDSKITRIARQIGERENVSEGSE